MRPIICDACQIRIDDSWAGPAIEVKVHNGVDTDVSGDYCVDCASSVADAIRSVIEDNKSIRSMNKSKHTDLDLDRSVAPPQVANYGRSWSAGICASLLWLL